MITSQDIARCCNARTFQRARQIAAHEANFLTRQCEFNLGDTALSAFVASSSGWADRYKTTVVLDEESGEVEDFSCTCPAFLKYDGLCKHSAALALAYIDDPHGFMGYRETRTPSTSPSLSAFMQKMERASVASGAEGSVDLIPIMSPRVDGFSVRFKIRGGRGTYVVKDLDDLVSAIQGNEFVTYGKKLAFTHSLSAFSPASRPLAEFILECSEQRRSASISFYWRMSTRSIGGRDLTLTSGETVKLLDLLTDREITVEQSDYWDGRRELTSHVVEDNPDIALRIAPVEAGGYEIVRDEPLMVIAEGNRMYVYQHDVFFRCTPEFARCADFFKSVYQSADSELIVAPEDAPLFCATVLPLLEGALQVQAPPELQLMKPVPAQLEFYFDRAEKAVELEAFVIYGTHRFDLFEREDAAEGPAPLRDKVLERRAKQLVLEYFDSTLFIMLADSEAVADLLFGGLAQFRALGEVFTTPAFDRLTSDRKPRTQIGLSIAGNLIDLDVSIDDVEPAEVSALLSSYRKRKRFHRLRNGVFMNMDDFNLHELNRMLDDFGMRPEDLAAGHLELPTYRAFFLDREFADARRDASFTSYIERFRAIDQDAYEPPAALAGTLRPYQCEGFTWLSALSDLGFGGILADEMGLGKSIQLISLLLARREEARGIGPSLIVCPASLVYNWLAEFRTFAPALEVRAIEGTKTERNRIRRDRDADVFVCSYDIARMDNEELERQHFYCHVLDEAQYIKNHATLTTRAVKRITSDHRFALTGTPIENRLSEIWSIFDFLMPGFLGSYARFRERYESDILGGDEQKAQRLQALIGPFILRRVKESVLPDLPEKMDAVVYVPLAKEQRALYAAHEQQLRIDLLQQKKDRKNPQAPVKNKVETLAELTKLRQIALDPALLYENYHAGASKMGAIMDLVEQAIDGGEKALVFSQFTSYLALIADELCRRDVPFYTITGSTPKKARLEMVNAFNADDTPVFLVSLKAGGTGLNLTGASVVIHADPWWNAAATNQATDRAHRIGQKRVVSVYKVIAKGTIEERILRLQEMKTELASSIVGEAGAITLANLTRDQLIELLGD